MALVVVAEDDHFFSSLLSIRLQQHGLSVVCAYDGVETLKVVRNKRPDLLLLDVLMPEKDGFEVLTELRASEETAKIPVLVATNLSDRDSLERGKKLGAIDVLVKANTTPEEIAQRALAIIPK